MKWRGGRLKGNLGCEQDQAAREVADLPCKIKVAVDSKRWE